MIHFHIKHLENKIANLLNKTNNLTIPTCFEYYSAISLTKKYKTPFNVWKDVLSEEKRKRNFPIRDKGIDIVNENFSIIAQSKYYTKSTITYGKLSTFLATDKIVDQNYFQMILVRLSSSKIDSHVKHMILKEILIDFQIKEEEFIDYINYIKKSN